MKNTFISMLLFLVIANQKIFAVTRDTLPSKPGDGYYFINRNAKIDTANHLLYASIRPTEKTDYKNTTEEIRSNGEGWLNKDSLPIGPWTFYAHTKAGHEYIFKKGEYSVIDDQMIRLNDKDYDRIEENGFNLGSVLENAAWLTRFIKKGEWIYYYPGGKVWQHRKYRYYDLYIPLQFKGYDDNEKIYKEIAFEINHNPDEWSPEVVEELKENGKVYKYLYFKKDGTLLKTEAVNQ